MGDTKTLQSLLDSSWQSAGVGARTSWSQSQRMTAGQVLAFLSDQRYCAIATTGLDGDPHLVPVSFVSLDDGSFWLPAVAGTARLNDIRSRPRAALLVGQGVGSGHTLVLANGSVEMVTPESLSDEVRQRAVEKLGDTEWAVRWLVLRPDRIIAYAGHGGR